MFKFEFGVIKAITAAVASLAILMPATAFALMDITAVEMYWVSDRVEGSAGPTPYGIEIVVMGTELSSVDVTTPNGVGAGTFALNDIGGGEFEFDAAGSYANWATLVAQYPVSGVDPWSFQFNSANGAGDNSSFDIILNPSDMGGVWLDVTSPTGGSISPTPTITWADCSGCGANAILAELIDVVGDTTVDSLFSTNPSQVSWTPTNNLPLTGGVLYEIEGIIGDYDYFSGLLTADQTTTTPGDTFFFAAGSESVNIVQATATPEPGTAVLLGLGLMGLGIRRRAR